MMAIFAPLLFLFAFASACATIAAMLASHGGKMMAALRMDHGPRGRRIAVRSVAPTIPPIRAGLPMRAVRLPVPVVRALRAA